MTDPPSHPASPPRRRRWWFKPAALLLSMLFVFCLGEIVIRVLYGAPLVEHEPLLMIRANSYRGWEMMPGQPHRSYHHEVRVNALGLRGPEVGAKLPGERRILALGDSMVYGQGVGDDETIPHHMQRLLAARAKPGESFTVINGGLRGYSTNQECGLLVELGPVIKPDVVVLFWYWNDVVEHRIAEVDDVLSSSGPVTFETKTRLEGFERVKWDAKQLARRSALLMWLHDWTRQNDVPTRKQVTVGLARFENYITDLALMNEGGTTRFVVAIVPDPNELRAKEGSPHVSQGVNERAIAICEAAGVPVLRLADAAKRADRGGLSLPVVPYDGHFNGEANAAMAEAVVEWLMK